MSIAASPVQSIARKLVNSSSASSLILMAWPEPKCWKLFETWDTSLT